MKICFIVEHMLSGGVERTISYLSKYFAEQDHDTTILCISNQQFYIISDKVNLIKLGVCTEPCGAVERALRITKRLYKVNAELLKIQPDCIICLDCLMLKYIKVISLLKNTKIITSERNNPQFLDEKTRAVKLKYYSKSDGIVFQTNNIKALFPDDIISKCVVIPNAVGSEYVYTSVFSGERRNVITAVGRLTDQKDYPTMFKAFAKFSNKHPDYTLEVYGNGELKPSLEQMTCDLKISKKIIFKGAVPDAIKYVESSACYVMSSIYEGMPNSLMEALAVGTPCVSTDCNFGPSELITNGENGLLVPIKDPDKLYDAITKMVDDTSFAEKCGKNARNILKTKSIDNVARRYLDYVEYIYQK